MKTCVSAIAFTLGTLATASAQDTFAISIGVRETGFGGSTVTTLGANGGSTGGIEWINRDGQTLPIDGQWHTFSFDFGNDPILGFAGTSANSILEGTHGTLEHVRILNSTGVTVPVTILIDDIVDTTATLGAVTITDFEGYAAGSAVMFQPPGFSGSTASNVNTGSTTGIEQAISVGSDADRFDFQFIDNSPTRWVRLTSFNTGLLPNPVVQFDDNSVVTFRMMAFTESQADMGSQGPGTATAAIHGSGLNDLEASMFHADNAPANTIGAIAVSIPGLPDLPILGGNVVSGAGYLFSIPVFTNADGYASLPMPGSVTLANFNLQAVFFDTTLPQQIAFSNAVAAPYGQ